jgi:hypothetical protein
MAGCTRKLLSCHLLAVAVAVAALHVVLLRSSKRVQILGASKAGRRSPAATCSIESHFSREGGRKNIWWGRRQLWGEFKKPSASTVLGCYVAQTKGRVRVLDQEHETNSSFEETQVKCADFFLKSSLVRTCCGKSYGCSTCLQPCVLGGFSLFNGWLFSSQRCFSVDIGELGIIICMHSISLPVPLRTVK